VRPRDWLALGATAAATAGVLALGGLGGVALHVLQLADRVFVAFLRAVL
jgi:hypothetical protein